MKRNEKSNRKNPYSSDEKDGDDSEVSNFAQKQIHDFIL